MGLSLSGKLEQLGADGRARLGRAWSDREVTNRTIETRFGLHALDMVQLRELVGPRPPKPGPLVWRRRDDKRQGVVRERG